MRRTVILLVSALMLLGALCIQSDFVSADPHLRPSQGELSGKRIFVSAGHGYYWHATLGWTTQRGLTHGIVEDHSNAMLMIDYIIPYLKNAGAEVGFAREIGYITDEFIGDVDDANFSSTGTWTFATTTSGYWGTGYRYAATSLTETAVARWDFNIAREGRYPVYVWFNTGGNRADDALYRVHHGGGVAEVRVNQRSFSHTDYTGAQNTHNLGSRWVFLGEWEFTPDSGAAIEVSNQSADPTRVVMADGVKLGGGMGSISRGGSVSGRARWEECSRYWAQFNGAPTSVYDTSSTDNGSDVTCRPRLMKHWGGYDLYFSLHSNAFNGTARGTVTLSYDNSGALQHPQALINVSNAFRNRMNAQVADDVTALHDPTWVTRTPYGGNFGELRLSDNTPSCLLESAFHDNATDASYLRNPKVRHTMGRAAYKAIVRQLINNPVIVPLPPRQLAMRNTGNGDITITWQPTPDTLEASAVPTGYRVYLSDDGFAFDSGRPANGTESHTLSGLTPGQTVFARVTATNAGGESLWSEMLCARTPDAVAQGLATPLLIVSGYTRLDEFVWHQQGINVHTGDMHMRQRFDSVRYHALAAANAQTAAGGAYFFDSASRDAVVAGDLDLDDYAAVNWVLGNQSTQDRTFTPAMRTLVQAFLAGGGSLFVSGSDLAFDLGGPGSAPDDQSFLEQVGGVYVADNSNSWSISAGSGVFAGVGAFTIDDGTGNNYTVLSPDVIGPATGAATVLTYGTGASAAVEAPGVIAVGFPFECINESAARDALMQSTLEHILPGYTGIGPTTGGGSSRSSSGSCVSVATAGGPLILLLLLPLRRRRKRPAA